MTPVILIEFEDEFFLEAMDLVLNQRKKKQKKNTQPPGPNELIWW